MNPEATGLGHNVVLRAGSDPVVTGDVRTLQQLTALEKTCQVSQYFGTVQKEIQPSMRRLLASVDVRGVRGAEV
ncbi:hypothetical protein Q5P01_001668 [Channa striata]|uniref:Uncharacterized protein n=1 Tax=Channa striata TaxID=64152 RepID=A0AA88NMU4_CHASR|nr:hypothetical protein Q5P01_001668 [Channa striata]